MHFFLKISPDLHKFQAPQNRGEPPAGVNTGMLCECQDGWPSLRKLPGEEATYPEAFLSREGNCTTETAGLCPLYFPGEWIVGGSGSAFPSSHRPGNPKGDSK